MFFSGKFSVWGNNNLAVKIGSRLSTISGSKALGVQLSFPRFLSQVLHYFQFNLCFTKEGEWRFFFCFRWKERLPSFIVLSTELRPLALERVKCKIERALWHAPLDILYRVSMFQTICFLQPGNPPPPPPPRKFTHLMLCDIISHLLILNN